MERRPSEMTMLEVQELDAGYGDIQVLWDINITVEPGETIALVGPNGAGKSTLLKTIAGLILPMKGEIHFDGQPITKDSPDVRVQAGLSLVPEGRRLFAGLSVEDNLLMGAYLRRDKEGISRDLLWVYDLFPEVEQRKRSLAGDLSGGEQQMCAIGRGLMASPRLLLIDELSLGLAPVAVDRLLKAVRDIQNEGVVILLVEQDVQTAFELAHRGYVIETGHMCMQGSAQELLNDEYVKTCYLGI
jgi:branched-chain amino acid transport system ATP-binding protein